MLFGFAVLVKLRNFSNPWSRPKDIRLFWLLNYNDLHEDTHHYGPSDPVGSFCGIAEKQLYLITYGPVDTVERRLAFIPFQFQGCYFGEWHPSYIRDGQLIINLFAVRFGQKQRSEKMSSYETAIGPNGLHSMMDWGGLQGFEKRTCAEMVVGALEATFCML